MKSILLLAMIVSAMLPIKAFAESSITIYGKVLDHEGKPAEGALVAERDSSDNATKTAFNGSFSLKVKPDGVLTISHADHRSTEVPVVNGLIVKLKSTRVYLDEEIVVPYGRQKRANVTGSISTIDVAKAMSNKPMPDVATALRGAVPGLSIGQYTSSVNQKVKINIRGIYSLSNGGDNPPLILVDGSQVDDIEMINPEDIKSVSVLKDAASTSIYGTRAAFGVILITTK